MSDDLAPVGALLTDRLAQLQQRHAALDWESDDEPDEGESVADLRSRHWSVRIPSRFLTATIDQFADPSRPDFYQPTVANDLERWARNPQGRNLVCLGPVGSGKTHAAVAAARVCHDDGLEVWYRHIASALDDLRPGGPERALERMAAVDVLILDDLGVERPTGWTDERMNALVDWRWREERPIIATSNLPATNRTVPDGYSGVTLEQALGPRVFSRLCGADDVVLRLTGPNRRKIPRG